MGPKEKEAGKQPEETIVEGVEIEVNPESGSAVPEAEAVTEESAAEAGLDPQEIALAKEHNIIENPDAAEAGAKKEEDNPENGEPAGKKTEKPEETVSIEQKKAIQEAANTELDPNEEKELIRKYTPNEKALYYKAKKERKKRQTAEELREEAEKKAAYHEARAKAFEEMAKKGPGAPAAEPKKEESGKLDIDPEAIYDASDVEKIVAQERAKWAKAPAAEPAREEQALIEQQRIRERETAQRNRQVLQSQIDEVRDQHEGYDAAAGEAAVIINATAVFARGNKEQKAEAEIYLEELFDGDRDKVKSAMKLAEEFASAMANGGTSKYGEKAAEIAYKLGTMSPKFNQQKAESANSRQVKKVEAERVEKAIVNSQKPKIPASITGSGRAVVPYADLTPEQVANMSIDEWEKLPEKVREKFLRGS